ncbi:MAG: glycine cleavage system protein GcvH [Burkholderiales bacterium]|jgi:glycine cleavage system H protein
MIKTPQELKYAKTHEWVRQEADGTAVVGITDFAQEALGDIVFLELPEVGRKVKAGEACAVVESVKAASDIYAPLSGEIVAANSDLADALERVNQDAYAAWLFKVKPSNAAAELGGLLDAAGYAAAADAAK